MGSTAFCYGEKRMWQMGVGPSAHIFIVVLYGVDAYNVSINNAKKYNYNAKKRWTTYDSHKINNR